MLIDEEGESFYAPFEAKASDGAISSLDFGKNEGAVGATETE